jgi:hypothetical protein
MGYNYNEGIRLLTNMIKCSGLQEPTPIILEVRSRGEGLAATRATPAQEASTSPPKRQAHSGRDAGPNNKTAPIRRSQNKYKREGLNRATTV